MKKRIVLLFVAMLGIALQSVAQSDSWKSLKIVRVDNGVNLRKSPSTASPRLVTYYDPYEDGGDSDGTVVNWESTRSRSLKAKSVNASVVPVLSETGDWYKVWFETEEKYGPGAFAGDVYVAKRFCHEVKRVPISITNSSSNSYIQNLAYNAKKNGNEYFIYVDDGGGDLMYHLGRIVDGYCVLYEAKDIPKVYDAIENVRDTSNPTKAEINRLVPLFKNKPFVVYYGIEGMKEWYSY